MPLALLAGCQGCRDTATTASGPTGSAGSAWSDQYREELLTYALDSLNRSEEFEAADAARQIPERLELQKKLQAGQSASHIDPLLAAWPEPEMLRQVVDRLNRWIRTQPPLADWRVDPMAAALPKAFADLSPVADLDKMEFSRFDGYVLREVVWLRDIGRWARGDALDDLERAKSLFDWTVRNIQLEADRVNRVPLFPWEALMFGRGTSTERAWVFILLARQLGIDAAMLAVGQPSGPAEAPGGSPPSSNSSHADAEVEISRSWCIAVLIEGNAYLFEPLLGLPIPAAEGIRLDATGQLAIQPATLAQAVADEKVLRQLDFDQAHAYGVKSSDLKHVVAMLEASPTYLAQRMKVLESHLAGGQKMVLTTSPTTRAERWKALAHVAGARLWLSPFETLERRSHLAPEAVQTRLVALLPFFAMPSAPLYRGRILQLKGRFSGDEGAVSYYQMARPPQEALSLSSVHPVQKIFFLEGKQDASYWLGLIAYQRGNYEAAMDSFFNRTLRAVPNSPWTSGAQYNLGRTCEARGDIDAAIRQYENNVTSPGYLGDVLRAKWLKNLAEKKRKEKAAGG